MMIKHHTLLLLLACLGSSSRTKAQINELSKRGQTATVTDAQQSQVIDKSEDQQTSSAIISVRYRDKLGKLKTVKAKTNKLSLKRKKPRKSAKLRKNKGRLRKQKIRKGKKPTLSFQTLLPATPVATDVTYDYEYEEDVVYDEYDEYDYDYDYDYGTPIIPAIAPVAPVDSAIIQVFGPDDHDPHHSVPVLIHEDHTPHSYGHQKPHYPYHRNKQRGKNPGYSHVAVETPGYRYSIENYGESSYGYHNKHNGGYGHHAKPNHHQPNYAHHAKPNYGSHSKPDYGHHVRPNYQQNPEPNYRHPLSSDNCDDYRPKFGCPKETYHARPHYPPLQHYYPSEPYHPPPPSHGYPHQEEVYLTPYAPQPKPYYIKDPYHHYHPDPYQNQQHHYPQAPLPSLYHNIPPPRHKPVVVHQESDPFHHRRGPIYRNQGPVHHNPPILDEALVPIPPAVVDGRAYGADLVGNFDQATGSFGPSGFYANYYDEK